MKELQKHIPEIIRKITDIEECKQYTLWLIGALPVLSIFAISYFMHPALQ